MAERMATESNDYYDILGVSRDADAEQIQRAYRTLARRHHPDVNKAPGAEDRFKKINEAYNVLSDPGRRRKYDQFGDAWRQIPDDFEQAAGRTGAGAWDRAAAGAGGGRGGARGFRSGRAAGGVVDVEDLFESLFGGRAGGPRGFGPVRGADTEAELTISVEDAFHGGRRKVTLPAPSGGTREYEVTIPRGVTEGSRIRLAGQGGSGADGGPRGDLYLRVHLAPHPRYRVKERDITVDLPVAPWEAALGATVPLATPDGVVRVHAPPGTPSGRRLRLRGKGMPNPRGDPGDLYANIKIVVPPKLSDEERRLLEQWARVSTFDPRRMG
ncbi:J domain-containing protein [Dactylosporangium roseum]